MSYLSNELEIALGGKNYASGKNSQWSPNLVKTLIIGRYYILVENHVGGMNRIKVTNLDGEEMSADCESMYTAGSYTRLFSPLKARVLSSLEEVYFDKSLFSSSSFVGYLKSWIETLSNYRIRYYGLLDLPEENAQALKQLLESQHSKVGSSLYQNIPDKSLIQDCQNTSWYKNIALRPANYAKDSENGDLARYFRKIKTSYAIAEEANSAKSEEDAITTRLLEMASSISEEEFSALVEVYGLPSVLSKNDKLAKIIVGSLQGASQDYNRTNKIKGFNNYWCQKLLEVGVKSGTLDIFKKLGAVGEYENTTINLETLKSYPKLFDTWSFLDYFSYRLYSNSKSKYKLTVKTALAVSNLGDCKIARELGVSGKEKATIEQFMSFINNVTGIKL